MTTTKSWLPPILYEHQGGGRGLGKRRRLLFHISKPLGWDPTKHMHIGAAQSFPLPSLLLWRACSHFCKAVLFTISKLTAELSTILVITTTNDAATSGGKKFKLLRRPKDEMLYRAGQV
jgi:hypothetical protein